MIQQSFRLEACEMAAEIGWGTVNGSKSATQLKLSLRGIYKPRVWRRVHDVIQTSMGWTDTHLHVFSTAAGDYGVPDPEAQIPACLAGKGACPPEDCGGPWGYTDLKETLDDTRHDDHPDMLDWLGLDSAENFDPAVCDLVEINKVLEMTAAAPHS
jgi:hypothetical protein